MSKEKWVVMLAVVVVLAAFAYLGWPTPWYYVPPVPGDARGGEIARIHRVTGEVQRARWGYWEQVVPPWSKARPRTGKEAAD